MSVSVAKILYNDNNLLQAHRKEELKERQKKYRSTDIKLLFFSHKNCFFLFKTGRVSCFHSDGYHGLQGSPDVLMLKLRQTCIQMCALTMRRRATSNIPYNMRT